MQRNIVRHEVARRSRHPRQHPFVPRRHLEGEEVLRRGPLAEEKDDGAARARVSFEVTDHWSVYVRGDVLYGDRDGVFGQFDANDRVVFGFEWSRQWL